MGYLCSYWCLSGTCHGADDWKAKVVCKAFFCPLVLCMSAQPRVHRRGCRHGRLASNPEVLCTTILCRAQDRDWWNTFCHFDVYLSDTVLCSFEQNYNPNIFFTFDFFFFLKQVWRKKYKKIRMPADQLSHPLRNQQQQPQNSIHQVFMNLEALFQERLKLVDFASLVNTLRSETYHC